MFTSLNCLRIINISDKDCIITFLETASGEAQLGTGQKKCVECNTTTKIITIPSTIRTQSGVELKVKKVSMHSFYGVDCKELSLPNTIEIIDPYSFENAKIINGNFTNAKFTELFPFSFYNSNFYHLVLPESLIKIHDKTFQCAKFVNMQLPNIVTMGSQAFENSSLISLNLSHTVIRSLEEATFRCCMIESVILPNTIISIGKECFFKSTIQKLNFPVMVEEVPDQAFAYSSIRYINLTGVKKIGDKSFYMCSNLASVTISSFLIHIGVKSFFNCCLSEVKISSPLLFLGEGAFESCSFIKVSDLVLSGLSKIPKRLFYNVTFLTEVKLPISLNVIGESAFEGTGINKIEIPISVKSICASAFAHSCLEVIDLSLNSINEIGNSAFAYTNLIEIILPHNVLHIGKAIFEGSALTKIDFTNVNIRNISDRMFAKCKHLAAVTLPSKIECISSHSFEGTLISTFTFNQNFKEFKEFALANMAHLKCVDLSKSLLESIPAYCFSNSSLESILMPPNLSMIGLRSFEGTNIRNFVNPPKVTKMDDAIFKNCKRLKEFNVGFCSVDNIPNKCFSGCANLTDFIGNVSTFGDFCFEGTSISSFVIEHNVNKLGIGIFMDSKLEKIDMSNSILTELPAYLFANCKKLNQILYPSKLKSLGEYCLSGTVIEKFDQEEVLIIKEGVFEGCILLKSVKLPLLDNIPNRFFNCCKSLKDLKISSHPLVYGSYSFAGTAFTVIDLPKSIQKLGNNCFERTTISKCDLSKLTNDCEYGTSLFNKANIGVLFLPITFKEIPNYFFNGCSILDLAIPDSCVSAGDFAFASSTIKTVRLNKIQTLGNYCFSSSQVCSVLGSFSKLGIGCFENSSISSITLGFVSDIPEYCFSNCLKLTHIESHSHLKSIGRYGFRSCLLSEFKGGLDLQFIADSSFEYSHLKTVDLSGTLVSSIEDCSFKDCHFLSEIKLPKIYKVGERAFLGTKIENIELCDSLLTLGPSSFSGTPLTKIDLSESKLKEIAYRTFAHCTELSQIKLPNCLTKIGEMSFSGTKLTIIEISPSLKIIFPAAFISSAINYIDLSNTKLKEIPPKCFEDCRNLRTVIFPSALKSIGAFCFSGASINKIEIPKNVEFVYSGAFQKTNIASIDLSMTNIVQVDEKLFYRCRNLRKIFIPNTVEFICSYSFAKTQISSFKFSNNLKVIKEYSFADSPIRYLDLQHTILTDIESFAFIGCHIRKITLPNTIKHISTKSFDGFTGIVYYCGSKNIPEFPFKNSTIIVSKNYPDKAFGGANTKLGACLQQSFNDELFVIFTIIIFIFIVSILLFVICKHNVQISRKRQNKYDDEEALLKESVDEF